VAGLLTLALALGAGAGSARAAEEFKIGVITSLSGDLATGGNVTKRGYDLWAKAVNAQGGIEVKGKKYPVRLIYGDDQSQPARAASAAERLAVQEKVDLQTFYGHVKFAAEGDYYHSNAGLTPLTIQILDGNETVVAPAQDAQAKLLYPMTPWNKR
jgi:hypothetical protein